MTLAISIRQTASIACSVAEGTATSWLAVSQLILGCRDLGREELGEVIGVEDLRSSATPSRGDRLAHSMASSMNETFQIE